MAWDAPTVAATAAAVTLLLYIGEKLFGGGWNLGGKLSRMEGRIDKNRNDMEARINAALNESKKEIEDRQDRAVSAFDETLRALREKISTVELDTSKHYVRREDLRDDLADIKASIKNLSYKIDRNGRAAH